MCGICGIYEYGGRHRVDARQLQRMSDAIAHRGPDDEGMFVADQIGLAVRRLSIIDIAGGHQPVTNEDESCWIAFNGEIYNYEQLRDGLMKAGHRFRSKSDTEVVLHLYEEYGPRCVDRLDGMFAFAIYDGRKTAREDGAAGRLLLARDRLGKKPLYYGDVDGSLVFGSELKSVLCDSRVGKDLDFSAVGHYLSLLVVPSPFSIFKGVRKLPAGHLLHCDTNGVRIERYWNYVEHVRPEPMRPSEIVPEVRRLFFEAVRKRLIGEVPVGAFLSGGMDSSAVVAVMSVLTGQPVKTYSIGFEGPEYFNELPYARALAQHYGTEHHEFLVNSDILNQLPDVVRSVGEPMAVHSTIALNILSKALRGKAKVVLTGDGGDEVLGGYAHYIYEKRAAIFQRMPRWLDGVLGGASSGAGLPGVPGRRGFRSRTARFVANARRSVVDRRLDLRAGFVRAEIARLCPQAVSSPSGGTEALLQACLAGTNGFDAATKVNTIDMLLWLPDEMLAKVDRMTMASSIEARCPFMDWPLVEFLAKVPMATKIPGWGKSHLKSLLRGAVGDLLPPHLLKRPKHTFDLPLDVWFRGGARDYLETMLSPDRIRRQGIFEPEAVADVLRRHHAGEADAGCRLFTLLTFQVWAEAML